MTYMNCCYPKIPCNMCSQQFKCVDAAKNIAKTIIEEPMEDDYGKEELKPLHCRICGRTYYDKAEVKACERSHDWHNNRGRR